MDQEESVRGREKNKYFWTEEEVQALIEILQDMACDPAWKTNGGFKNNYMTDVNKRICIKIPTFTKQVTSNLESKIKWLKTKFHVIDDMLKESGCQWNDVEKKIACERQWFDNYSKDFKFPYLNQLELVYGKDRATDAAAQGFEDVIQTMEADQKNESGGETLGDYFPYFSFEEEYDVNSETQSTPSVRNAPFKQKRPLTSEYKVAKRKKPVTHLNVGAQLTQLNAGFCTFVEGFTSNFATIANGMAEENKREKAASERMKDAIAELMNPNLPSGDVFKVANIFAADKEKIDVFMNLPSQMQMHYVLSLLVPPP